MYAAARCRSTDAALEWRQSTTSRPPIGSTTFGWNVEREWILLYFLVFLMYRIVQFAIQLLLLLRVGVYLNMLFVYLRPEMLVFPKV